MSKARAMYIPAGGKKAVWGPVDQNVLPEGYPYKEQSEEVLIPEYSATPTRGPQGWMVLTTPENIRPVVTGETLRLTINGESCDTVVANASALIDFAFSGIGYPVSFAYNDYMHHYEIIFEADPGDVTVELIAMSETIHPMAEEFLPEGVQVVTLTGESAAALTSSHTGAEILKMAKKGLVVAQIVSDSGSGVLPLVTASDTTGAMFLMASGSLITGLGVALDSTAVSVYSYVS